MATPGSNERLGCLLLANGVVGRNSNAIVTDHAHSAFDPGSLASQQISPHIENAEGSIDMREVTFGNEIVTPGIDPDSPRDLADDSRDCHTSEKQNYGGFGSNARTSSAGMTQEIIDRFSPKTVLGSSTSALPGGSKPEGMPRDKSDCSVWTRPPFDFDFPPKPVADYLLETYLGAVHWFMMVFHEPTLRRQYENILTGHRCRKSNSKQLTLILLVLSLGARYTTEERVRAYCPMFDLDKFRNRSLAKVEERLLELLDGSDVESVQVCVLLGSFYLYHGRPNLAFVILGAGIRCSQIMGLYKESSWRDVSEVDKEERRRTFWALYVFDRFASIVYGKPCCIQREVIDVKLPQNLGDTKIEHPHFHTIATMPDGITESVTTFTYVKFKIKLYQIASPIVAGVYFHRDADLNSLATKVMRIDKQLRDWFASLPPELKLEEMAQHAREEPPQNARLFMLQALALQLAYNNVRILLHRPLLSQNIQGAVSASSGEKADTWRSGERSSTPSRGTQSVLLTSRDHCWESAVQSSNLGIYGQCLDYARETHAAAFLGINLFTASMVLCVFALSNPISTQAQLAKQAVTRIMSLSRFLSYRSILSDQTNQVLVDLVHLILEKERRVMLFVDKDPITALSSHNHARTTSRDVATIDATPPPHSECHEALRQNNSLPLSPDETNLPLPTAFSEDITNRVHNVPDFGILDFDDGIATLQEAMFPTASTQESWNLHSDVGIPAIPLPSCDRMLNADFDITNSIGQTWLWNPFSESYRS
ncbi:hypothetical protein BBP40_003915 [Aspergillus hancockii]|nr:hypothetical protein BBP40_003915 [Aspergillus hancockii]